MTEQAQKALLAQARDALLAQFPDALAIYAYGSRVSGGHRADSDLDLAILLPAGHRTWDKLTVLSELPARLRVEVDLVELGEANDVLRREVLASGDLLYAADAHLVLAWEGSAMSRYQRYREEVKDLMEDFRRSGVGYAG